MLHRLIRGLMGTDKHRIEATSWVPELGGASIWGRRRPVRSCGTGCRSLVSTGSWGHRTCQSWSSRGSSPSSSGPSPGHVSGSAFWAPGAHFLGPRLWFSRIQKSLLFFGNKNKSFEGSDWLIRPQQLHRTGWTNGSDQNGRNYIKESPNKTL